MSKSRNSVDLDDDLDDLMPEDLSILDRLALAWDRPSTRWLVMGLVAAVSIAVIMAMRSGPAQTATVPTVSRSGSAAPVPSSSDIGDSFISRAMGGAVRWCGGGAVRAVVRARRPGRATRARRRDWEHTTSIRVDKQTHPGIKMQKQMSDCVC